MSWPRCPSSSAAATAVRAAVASRLQLGRERGRASLELGRGLRARRQAGLRLGGGCGQRLDPGLELARPGGAAIGLQAGGAGVALGLGQRAAGVQGCREGRLRRRGRLAQLAAVGRRQPLGLRGAGVGLLGGLGRLGHEPLRIGAQPPGQAGAAGVGAPQRRRGALEPPRPGGEPLPRGLEVVVGLRRPLLLGRQAGQLGLGLRPPLADGGELCVDVGLGRARVGQARPGGLGAALLGDRVRGDEPQPARGDLAAQPGGPLGRRRLHLQRPQPGAHLTLEVAGALELRAHAGELGLGPQPPPLVLA
jgi:hypothetical protein